MQTTPFEDSRCATRPVGPRLVACPTTACPTTLSRKAVSRSWQRGPKTHGLVMDSRSVALKTVAPKIVMLKTAASATVVLRQRVRRARRVTVGLGSPLWIGHWVQKATVWRDRPTGRRHLATVDDKFWGPKWRRAGKFSRAGSGLRSAPSVGRTCCKTVYGDGPSISGMHDPCILTDGTGGAGPKPF